MKWCYLCSTEFPQETPMVMARGGSQICRGCAATPRGLVETESDQDRQRRLFNDRPGRGGPWGRFDRMMARLARGHHGQSE